ncbi:Predicted arabinose efflux permease, MFS family [bacterium A37T11]|nr:Predicted arabinose efflux permease, MFS family [bacterium A37T11]
MDKKSTSFTGNQKLQIFILAITQFTVILDFMVMSPLGDFMMKSLSLSPSQFGTAVSAYAYSAGLSGLLTAGFADRFDRKKLLLFFYTGFIVGTFLCGLSHSYYQLVAARILTGIFGGVIGSISLAIITDLFSLEQRGRVMGFMQMGFGASQVLGVPIGLFLANRWDWSAPFLLVAILACLISLLIVFKLQPITGHLSLQQNKTVLRHLWHTLVKNNYYIGFISTALLSLGAFMMFPFGSAFAVNNLKISPAQLPLLFLVSGVCALFLMPLIGRLSDKINKAIIFTIASVWMIIVCLVYTQLGETPLWMAIGYNVLLMMGIMSRMVPAMALVSAVPEQEDRGAFMSINSSIQQISGGIAASIAGLIVVQAHKAAPLEHYDKVAYVLSGISIVGIYVIFQVAKLVAKKSAATPS